MLRCCRGQRRGSHVKRGFRGLKVTILFLILTLVMCRYLLSSDDLSASENDLHFLHSRLSGALLQARHILRDPPVVSSETVSHNPSLPTSDTEPVDAIETKIDATSDTELADLIDTSDAAPTETVNAIAEDPAVAPTNIAAYEPPTSSPEPAVIPETAVDDSATDPNSYETLDLRKIFVDEQLEQERTSNKPYRLGPKIKDWNQQRANWLKANPNFPNYVQPGKPRVLLVTGSSPKPCENSVGDHMLLKSIKNKIDYCRIHGIEIFYNMALYDAEMSGFWAKLPLIRSLLLSHPEVEFLWWMDSDAMFTDMAFELPWERYKNYNLIMHGWNDLVYEEKDWVGLNTGSFLIRNNQWTLELLDAWAPMGPKGKIRNQVGEMLSRELKDRPVFEADDQSAIVYMLVNEKWKWGEKVYLEHKYFLHGYWKILVERYEEMMKNYHPGFGDKRWPLVTHFVGCKPCQKIGNNPVESCLKHMERAYNFGDNQILLMYGFAHKSLSSRRVKRIRDDTSNVLEVRDEFDLLHPSFKAVDIPS